MGWEQHENGACVAFAPCSFPRAEDRPGVCRQLQLLSPEGSEGQCPPTADPGAQRILAKQRLDGQKGSQTGTGAKMELEGLRSGAQGKLGPLCPGQAEPSLGLVCLVPLSLGGLLCFLQVLLGDTESSVSSQFARDTVSV